jgi:hypothetical protein
MVISRKVLLGGVASIGLAAAARSTSDAAQPEVVGAWKLESFDERIADGSFKPRFGPNPVGYLIYTASGRVSATLSGIHRGAAHGGRVVCGHLPRIGL